MRKVICLILLYTSFYSQAFSQTLEVTGKVVDANGTPIARASIQEKSSLRGTTSDGDGNFKLTTATGRVLVISYVGFTTKEVTVGSSPTLSIALALNSNETLNEVVVTSFGVKREKKGLGYAVATVGKEQLELRPEGDLARVLNGKAPVN